MLQLPGFDKGLLAALKGGEGLQTVLKQAESAPGATMEQLQQLFEALRADGDPLAAELQAMLLPLLQGGISLPQTGHGGGASMPSFAALARIVAEGDSPGKPGVEGHLLSGSGARAVSDVGSPAQGKIEDLILANPGARLSERTGLAAIDPLLNQADQPPRMAASVPPPVSGAAFSLPGQPSGLGIPLPSNNLLAMPVSQPVSDPAWGAAIGERLVWMARGDRQMAELKISPPNLGPLEVRLNINQDQASVSFVSHHAQVRDAIEAAIPRLREMLAEQSLNLVQADVGSGRQGNPDRPGEGAGGTSPDEGPGLGTAEGSSAESSAEGQPVAGRGRGLLDLFA